MTKKIVKLENSDTGKIRLQIEIDENDYELYNPEEHVKCLKIKLPFENMHNILKSINFRVIKYSPMLITVDNNPDGEMIWEEDKMKKLEQYYLIFYSIPKDENIIRRNFNLIYGDKQVKFINKRVKETMNIESVHKNTRIYIDNILIPFDELKFNMLVQ